MHITRTRKSPSIIRSAWLVAAVIVLSSLVGCNTVAKYREARATFNRAAEIENGVKIGALKDTPAIEDPMDPEQRILTPRLAENEELRSLYRAALATLQSIDGQGEAELHRHELLADKLTLEALCHWRLGEDDKAEDVGEKAAKLFSGNSPQKPEKRSRDSYMIQALPGLIMNDQAHRMILEKQPLDAKDFKEIKDLLIARDDCAWTHIHNTRIEAERGNHDIKDYLLHAEIAVYRNLMEAYGVSKDTVPTEGGENVAFENSKENLPKAKCLLKELKARDSDKYLDWLGTFGLSDDRVVEVNEDDCAKAIR